ncbi:MAG: hydrogenase expression protein [Actinobacteria bacterium]|nr:hydrogenase expression protein [Actinomycetota bacterium]
MSLPAGKLPLDLLRALLHGLPRGDPSVVVGADIGTDAAVLDLGGSELLVAKTDPITFATIDAGRYLLAVNANDLATTGGAPRWLLVTALLPEGISRETVTSLFVSLTAACARGGVSLIGGHTEITVGLPRPIVLGALLGTVARDRLVRTSGARPGDAILLTGGIAVEGTALLAREHAPALRAAGVAEAVIARAAALLDTPGIEVLPAARALHATGRVHAMHDPTEGGLAMALHELAEAAGAGLRVEADAIPVLPETAAVCAALGLDPLGLLASGALLATLAPSEVEAALARAAAAGVRATRIGAMTEPQAGRVLVAVGGERPLPAFARDELARFLSADPTRA